VSKPEKYTVAELIDALQMYRDLNLVVVSVVDEHDNEPFPPISHIRLEMAGTNSGERYLSITAYDSDSSEVAE